MFVSAFQQVILRKKGKVIWKISILYIFLLFLSGTQLRIRNDTQVFPCVDASVGLQAIALRKLSRTYITFVRFLPGVTMKMLLEFKGVRTDICAMRTLIQPLS